MTKLNFLIDDAMMSRDAQHWLVDVYLNGSDRYETNHAHEFWNGRLLAYRDAFPNERALMVKYLHLAILRVRSFYGIREPLYADVLHLVGWPAGSEMPVHADNCQLDGSSNGLSHRAFSGVYYLTEGHDGALVLPNQGLQVPPRPGRFVSLPCGLSHLHGVRRTSMLRITMAFFLTFDREKADPNLI